ncbi:HEPN domain-containing protein [Microbacterium sp. NPDC089696]|uniref:ApeA N-terminal domain 1-containing protein n=1 Tax=Microbacterium sp. NPDC089696 TaxID=3364199 RepID=UPI0038035E76
MSATTHRGHWWLPGLPDDVTTGHLVVDDSGRCTLELIGSLDLRAAALLEHAGDAAAKAVQQERVRVVHGLVRGQPVTLLNCFAGHTDGFSHRDRSRVDLHVQDALIGAHVEPDEPAFRSALVEIENLTGWIGVEEQVHRTSDKEEGATLSRLEDLVAEVDGWTITARRTPQPFQVDASHGRTEVRSHVAAYLVVRAPEPRPAHDYHSVVLELMDLLTLASGRASGQISLTLIHRDDQVTPDRDGSALKYETRVETFGGRIHTAAPDKTGPLDWEFRFRGRDHSFEDVIPAWIRLRRQVADACNVFFGPQYARPTFTEARLLLVAIVAEALSAGLDGINPVTDRTTYRARLRALASKPDADAVATIIPDVEAWALDLHHARNTLAHTGNDDAGRDIFELEWRTSSLLALVFMTEIGMSAEVQRRAASSVLKLPWS